MNTKIFKTAIAAVTVIGLVAACAGNTDPSEIPVASPTVTETVEPTETPEPADTETETPEPVETETPEPEPTRVNVRKLKEGDIVPAEQITEARKAGVNVYETVTGENAGDGVVVKRGTLSKEMKADYIAAVSPGAYSDSTARAVSESARAVKVSVSIVHNFAGIGWIAGALVDGDTLETSGILDDKSEAIAAGKRYAKKYDIELLVVD